MLRFLLIILVMFYAVDFLAQNFEDVSEKFEVKGEEYKARMTQTEQYLFKIKIYHSVEGKWQKIYRKEIDAEFFQNIELLDWNLDGNLDVKFRFTDGATLENYHTLLIYKSPGVFQEVTNYYWYSSSFEPDEFLISSDPLIYYTNIRWGCAGAAYESVLFTLDADSVRVLGSADVDYCWEPFHIGVTKVSYGENTHYCDYSQAYVTKSSQGGDWRKFINHFWRHHYEEFMDN